jgi:branched-subunit amino acid aminotransferase/4-amino-4-deoxychorismate lyase
MSAVMELDGQPVSAEQSVALGLCNYGHFTSMLVSEQRVKGLNLHLSRLQSDCQMLFGTMLDIAVVRQRVCHALAQTEQPVVARVTVFDPDMGSDLPNRPATPRVLITTRPAGNAPPPPLRLRSVRYERELAAVKHVGLFGTVHHRRQARLAGYDDALFVNAAGYVSEGPTWNVAFHDGSQVYFPKAKCLPGVTMRLIQRCLTELGIPFSETRMDPTRAQTMRAAFTTNAVVGLRSIRSIDDTELPGDMALMTRLRDAYLAIPGTSP